MLMIPQLYPSEFTPSLLNLRKTSLSSQFWNKSIAPQSRIATAPATTITASLNNNLETISTRSIETITNPLTLIQNYKSQSVDLKATVSVKVIGGLSIGYIEDSFSDFLFSTSLELVLISSQASAGSAEGQTVQGFAKRKISLKRGEVKYECNFKLPAGFGEVGAIMVKNEHTKEMFFNNIVLTSSGNNPTVTVTCNSWVHSKDDNPHMRIFFTDKSYLPSQTPSGIKKLRDQELENLRGNGQGERKTFDRIYDYDTYNDLGNPDQTTSKRRPVLGGPIHPYPRRCRTGRGTTDTDPLSEKITGAPYYVPRDEAFSAVKNFNFRYRALRELIHGVIPYLETSLVNPDLGFPNFTRIDTLYNDGLPLPDNEGIYKYLLPRLIKKVEEGLEEVLLFEPPELIKRDKFSWFRDEEFARQTLAGLNPLSIQLVTEWPMKSKLDPDIYGPAESDITKEIVEREINGVMTLEEALEQKKLFVIDYHDILLPYVKKVRELEGTTMYGSRTLFFLNENNTLMPIAIELTRPVIDNKPEWRHVFTPSSDATNLWLWRFAKAHVLAHDSGYHQLVSHWVRTHCCMEPYIIAANRHLSVMHPIYKLLHPHFRYTMEINALAREALINADGIIENCFSPGRYSMELSSAAYDQLWRFDMEALPADLIRRGMAVEDHTAEHGVKLTIEDYPFANDGLILWDAIKTWVTDYVNHYYQDANTIETDTELQAWWTEVRTKGHADKKDEPWWPILDTKDSLVQTLSTIIWVASGHHAAVNFGQYDYAGYFPNRPTIARTNVPIEEPTAENFKNFIAKPEAELLKCFPSQKQAVIVMAVLDVLSTHSPDEEYIGNKLEPYWSEDPVIKAAFDMFKGRLTYMNGIIEARNADPKLRNRIGAGVVSYALLKQLSEPGVTGMGVPNSVSI